MKWLALLLVLFPIGARAACVPANAPAGSIGCQPAATSPAITDYVEAWQPGHFPGSATIMSLSQLLAAITSGDVGVGGNLSVTGTATLSGVTNTGSETVASGGAIPLTLSSGAITATGGNLGAYVPSDGLFVVHDSTNGVIATFGGATGTVTGRLNISPGISNNPILFTTSNSTNTNQGFAIVPAAGVASQILVPVLSLSGTYSTPAINDYNCNGVVGSVVISNCVDTMAASSSARPVLFNVTHYFGGSGATGSRWTANFVNILDGSTSDTQDSYHNAVVTDSEMRGNVGGISGTALGHNFGAGTYARLENGATYFIENSNIEHDNAIETGASAEYQFGVSYVLLSTNAVAPSIESVGFSVGSQTGATPTVTLAYAVGRGQGFNALASTATVLGYDSNTGGSPPTITNGVDFHLLTFTGNSWNDGHVAFDGSGEVNANSATALSLSATDGFFDPPTTAGVPTGAPAAFSALAHCAIDTTNGYLNCYYGSAWHKLEFASGAG